MRPGCMAPELVCLTWQSPGQEAQILHGKLDADRTLALVESWLASDTTLVAHHVCFDMAVLCAKWPHLVPLVFRAYDEDRITCTKLRQQLLDIARGEFRGRMHRFSKEVNGKVVYGERWIHHDYDLDAIVRRFGGRGLKKGEDSWRLRYAELIDIPLSQWPKDAVDYPLDDTRSCLDIYVLQENHAQFIPDQFRQAQATWALYLAQTWGLKADAASVAELETRIEKAIGDIEAGLIESGLVRENGSRDTKKAQSRMVEVCLAAGQVPRLTETGEVKFKELSTTGQFVDKKGRVSVVEPEKIYDFIASHGGISLDADACAAVEDDLLEDYAERTGLIAMRNKDLVYLKAGAVYPVHTSYGIAASGRGTSAKPNVQNPKRTGDVYDRHQKVKYSLPDVRECWVARDGYLFIQADFEQLELCTLAQVCKSLFGYSRLGDVLNAGIDPHSEFAARMLHISYEEAMRRKKDKSDKVFENARQTSKVANFGFPGGLGAESLCLYARKSYKVNLTPVEAKRLKSSWLEHWPEMVDFFNFVGSLVDPYSGEGLLEQIFSHRLRGGVRYTSACNSFFQGLGADAAKRAMYLVSKACYSESESVLYGARPVLFVHDEIVAEVPDDDQASDRAFEMARLMLQGANEFLPDVPTKTEPVLATRWSKRMKPVFEGCAACLEVKVPHVAHRKLVAWYPGIEAAA